MPGWWGRKTGWRGCCRLGGEEGRGWCVVTQSTSLIANMAEGMDGGYGSLSISINADPQCAAGVNSPVKRIAPPRFNCSSFAAAAVRAAVPRTSPYATHNDVIFQVAGVSLLLHPLPSPHTCSSSPPTSETLRHANISLNLSSLILLALGCSPPLLFPEYRCWLHGVGISFFLFAKTFSSLPFLPI